MVAVRVEGGNRQAQPGALSNARLPGREVPAGVPDVPQAVLILAACRYGYHDLCNKFAREEVATDKGWVVVGEYTCECRCEHKKVKGAVSG